MITLLPASVDDVQQLVSLENELFTSDRISPRQFRYLIRAANSICIKAVESGKILGYMVLLRRRASQKLRLYSIAVAAWARKLGVAKMMLGFAERAATEHGLREITLEVCESNLAAVSLYTSIGFNEYGKKRGYYEDGCTARLFSKHIKYIDNR